MSTETSVPWNMLRNMILILKNHLLPFAFSISHLIFMKGNLHFLNKSKMPTPTMKRRLSHIFNDSLLERPLQRHLTRNGSPALWMCSFLLLRMLISGHKPEFPSSTNYKLHSIQLYLYSELYIWKIFFKTSLRNF